jgi:hypothetical protein
VTVAPAPSQSQGENIILSSNINQGKKKNIIKELIIKESLVFF